ncbi:MAG: hypothetical protein BGO29_12405 [Bacteroidales bacterium 36-12]|nr:MAG: hypothetical protein BGO29_12405 [Bacteroidales bacterium 36-12]
MNQKTKKQGYIFSVRIVPFLLLLFFLYGLTVGNGVAQTVHNTNTRVAGVVVDETNLPLIGVSVVVQGNVQIGTVTDFQGRFALDVSADASLTFSYVGYQTQTVKISGGVMNVAMEPTDALLDEVVVVAYGTQKKKDLTGAISVVDADKMKKMQTADIGIALQGLAPGVSVTSSGLPGAGADINIRGIGSFSNVGPLYVIDGVIMQGTQREFNMNDVENIQILKDAASAALYGSRGANGVILITTKRGKAGATRINLNASYGISQIANRIEMMQTLDFLEIQKLAYENAGITWPGKPEYGQELYNTDWQDAFFKLGNTTDVNMSISGGNESGNYMFSFNYYDEDGVVIGPSHKRFNIRSNSEARKGIFTIGENFTFGRSISVPMQGSPFIDVARMCPTIPVKHEDGSYGYGTAAYPTYGTNPIALQELQDYKQYNNRLLGNAYLQIEPIKGLQVKTSLGMELFDYYDKYKTIYKQMRYLTVPEFQNQLVEQNGERLSLIWENTVFYQNKIGNHAFDALVGYTAQRTDRHGNSALTRNLLAGGTYWVLDQHGKDENEMDMGGNESTTFMTSLLGRINYSYADRYLLQLNVRRDASSRFGANYRYGTFPSVSAGWRISEEDFMQSVSWLDDLKFRIGYGILGDQQAIGDYGYVTYMHTSEGALFGPAVDPTYYPGTIQKGFSNSDLRWETRKTLNVGMDWTMLSQRLYGSLEYFSANVYDLLVKVELPWVTGTDASDYPWVNYGSMRNQGLELSVGWRDKISDFTYDISVNLSGVRNNVINLGGDDIHYSGANVSEPGRSIGDFKLLRTDGIFQNWDEVNSHTWLDPVTGIEFLIQPKAQPGDIRYKDLNNDGKIDGNDNSEDREYVGSPFPKMEGGVSMSFGYKGIDLSLFFYGVTGNYIYNGVKRTLESMNDVSNFPAGLKPWTGEGTSNTTPRPVMGQTDNTLGYSDRWIEKGDYLRLKNLQLGYTLPKVWMQKTNLIETCRVYFTAQNLFTITGYSGFDPEISGGSVYNKGNDNGHFPPVRTFGCGLQVSF